MAQSDPDPTPWYLREEAQITTTPDRPPIPQVPDSAPPSVEAFLTVLSQDYGLDNLDVFDLTVLDPLHPQSVDNQPFDYIIIGTGKSEKHVYKAGQELKHFIKHNFNQLAKINGLVNSTPSAVSRRRMLKRSNKNPLATDNDYGKPANSWVMCETGVDHICIHVLTEGRRDELDIESLFGEFGESGDTFGTGETLDAEVSENSESNSTGETVETVDTVETFQFDESTPGPAGETKATLTADTAEVNEITNSETTNKADESIPETTPRQIPEFFLARRRLHTKANLASTYEDLLQASPNTDPQLFIVDFETKFTPSLENYSLRAQFYGVVHILSPTTVPLSKVQQAFFDKYEDLDVVLNSDLHGERINDVVQFMKLLIDSPELGSGKDRSDTSYDLLSNFVMNIYRFSGDSIKLDAVPELVPLLWKLGFTSDSELPELGPSVVDETIYGETSGYDSQYNTSTAAENRARDVIDLLNYYMSIQQTPQTLSKSVRELQLFSYGNSGLWDQFWDHWNESINLLNDQNNFNHWLRLVVYLGLRADFAANKTFIDKYWKNTTELSGGFIENYTSHSGTLSETETYHVKLAVAKILNSVASHLNSRQIDEVRAFIK